MSVFEVAVDALFTDPHLAVAGLYRPGGTDPGIEVRVIHRQPDRVGAFGQTRLVAETAVFDLRVSDIAAPVAGDTIEVDGDLFVIQGAPLRDAERLVWTIEARPA
ncbi:MAG: hypothetical protein HWD60_02680 [Defluviicoccus sp.]|nr:MAG: hypothetical protein HWD60_02680 [Defluviicoccus sp.]